MALLSCLPATLYTWEPGLTDWHYAEYAFVPKAGGPVRPVQELLAAAQAAVPASHRLNSLELVPNPARAYIFQRRQGNGGLPGPKRKAWQHTM